MFGMDPNGNVWYLSGAAKKLTKIDTSSAELKPTSFVIPKNAGIYDTDTDSKGRTNIYIWTEAKIGIFDPRTSNTRSTRRNAHVRARRRADRRSRSPVGGGILRWPARDVSIRTEGPAEYR